MSSRDQADTSIYPLDAIHGPDGGAGPILDRETFSALEELAGEDDPDLVAELVGLYLEDSVGRMNQIQSAASEGDHEAIGRAAHVLKSSSASIGALPFSRTCGELERLSRSNSSDEIDALEQLLARAAVMYAEVRKALNSKQ